VSLRKLKPTVQPRIIPDDLLTDKNIVAKLPLVFRTIKGQKLTGEQLEKFARALEKLNEPE
jgi:hypothetical protein